MRVSLLIVMIFSTIVYPGVADLDRAFEAEDFEQLKQLLPSHMSIYPNDPLVLFFQGFVHSDPAQAVSFYKRVVTEYPTSKYADYAVFRIGQFHYFNADYLKARRYFSSLFRKFPYSDLRDDAQYLYCQSILAEGKVDSAKLFLKTFVQNARRSPFVDAAILDVESLGGLAQDELSKPAQKKLTAEYSIQVATYKNLSDADNAMQKLSRVFPHVTTGERTLGNATYYDVLIGKFDTKAKATNYARLYIKPHLNEYKVIELTN